MHAQPAETHSPGATWRRSVPFWGYPDLALAYSACLPYQPFRQTGLSRGGERRGATQSSHRVRTGLPLRRCGGALPIPPHAVTHFSRIFIGISLLLFQATTHTPQFKLPRLCVGCVTLGWPRAGSVNAVSHSLTFRSRSSAGRRL